MSTEDENLLEFAAKACGYWCYKSNCVDYLPRLGWDPLEDDGDAFRLMIGLRIDLTISGGAAAVAQAKNGRCCQEYLNQDPAAATRRAIVRAAAEIGKAMNNSTS